MGFLADWVVFIVVIVLLLVSETETDHTGKLTILVYHVA